MMEYKDHSACRECGKIADLINELCTACWNKEVAPNSRADLKLPEKKNYYVPVEPKYTPAGLHIEDFTDKLGRRWGMWSNGWIGVLD